MKLRPFTRDALGPSAMAGEIAPAVAYIYATALGFDEASAAKTVRFDTAIITYVDNFLHKKIASRRGLSCE